MVKNLINGRPAQFAGDKHVDCKWGVIIPISRFNRKTTLKLEGSPIWLNGMVSIISANICDAGFFSRSEQFCAT